MARTSQPVVKSGTSTMTGSTEMADHLLAQFEEYRSDRQELQKQWEDSRENYRGLFTDQDGKKWKTREGKEDWHSRTHVNLTKQKVTAAQAIIVDNMIRGGNIQFDLTPSPWDQLTYSDVPNAIEASMQNSTDEMRKLIQQQLLETRADRSLIKNTLSLAEYGITFSKRIVDTVTRRGWKRIEPKGIPNIDELILTGQISLDQFGYRPYKKMFRSMFWDYRACWNMFWDLETNHLHRGRGYYDRDYVDMQFIESHKGKKGFISKALDECIKDGKAAKNTLVDSDRDSLPPFLRELSFRKKTMRWMEYWGEVPRNKAEAFEEEMSNKFPGDFNRVSIAFDEDGDDDEKTIEVLCTICGRHIVQWVRTDRDDRPHEMGYWADELDELGPTGVADNVKDAQKVINGAVRTFEDNKKLSGNVILGIKRRLIDHMDKDISPGMIIDVNDAAASVQEAMQQYVIQDVGESLMSLINLIGQIGDQDSMIPKVQQGFQQRGDETAFEVAQRIESSGKYMSLIMKNIDENLVEPNIQGYYDRNMRDPGVKNGKGSYQVKAAGTQGFQNRVLQVAQLRQALMVIQEIPQIGAQYNVAEIGDKIMKSMDVGIDEFRKKPEEIQQEAQVAQQAQAKAVELEIGKQEAEIKKTEAQAQAEMAKAQADVAKAQAEMEKIKLEKLKTIAEIEKDKREAARTSDVEELRKRNQP